MGTGSMERSEMSSDFLCLRLQRLRTSSETVSSAAGKRRDESGPSRKSAASARPPLLIDRGHGLKRPNGALPAR